MSGESTFLYFAYGSNLLKERIHINNPSAVFQTTAKLKDYELCFNCGHDDPDRKSGWHGAGADIQEKDGGEVWGVVWQLHSQHIATLDEQEGVSGKIYRPIEVSVETPQGKQLQCRSYQQCCDRSPDILPSKYYVDVIVKGAIQNGVPPCYIDLLQRTKCNDFVGSIPLYERVMKQYEIGRKSSKNS